MGYWHDAAWKVTEAISVYRISREKYCRDLTGAGDRLYGGRWNPKGTSTLYTADSRALAAMELSVRIDLNDLPTDLMMMSLELPSDASIAVVDTLPLGWDAHPPTTVSQLIGKQFIEEGDYLVLKVPSVTVRGDYNYLLNPQHTAFGAVKTLFVEPFFLDIRLSHRS